LAIELPGAPNEGQAQPADYATQAVLITVPAGSLSWASGSFRHLGTSGFWIGSFGGNIPTTTSYSFKLGPNEPRAFDNIGRGTVRLLHVGADGNLEYKVEWST
jgi:hypothetical protein